MIGRVSIVLVAALLLLGCNRNLEPKLPTVYPVRGKITLNGRPLTPGTVVLTPKAKKKGYRGEGTLDKDGSFSVSSFGHKEGMVPGQYVLSVEPGMPVTETKSKPGSAKSKTPEMKSLQPDPKHAGPAVPAKYLSPETSDIEVNVEEKDNDLGEFKLKSEKAPVKKK